MKTVKFKTNINCSGCLTSVTPFLNGLDHIDTWKVDIANPDKILEVTIDDGNKKIVIDTLKKAGYKIEEIEDKI